MPNDINLFPLVFHEENSVVIHFGERHLQLSANCIDCKMLSVESPLSKTYCKGGNIIRLISQLVDT